jgi:L-methionine (R)-S-oxide reductase
MCAGGEIMREEFLEELRGLVSEATDQEGALRLVCQLIMETIPNCDWVGFYFLDPDNEEELVLGPYVGEPTEHERIPLGSGICGMAAESGETLMVDDVQAEPGYIACSPDVKSEIVIPISKDGQVLGELDIDSHTLAAFGDEERELLEEACEIIAEIL